MNCHGVKRQYKCRICSKLFRFQQLLKAHERKHAKQRLFVKTLPADSLLAKSVLTFQEFFENQVQQPVCNISSSAVASSEHCGEELNSVTSSECFADIDSGNPANEFLPIPMETILADVRAVGSSCNLFSNNQMSSSNDTIVDAVGGIVDCDGDSYIMVENSSNSVVKNHCSFITLPENNLCLQTVIYMCSICKKLCAGDKAIAKHMRMH